MQAGRPDAVKPAPFAYHRPDTLEEALDLLARYGGDAKPLAGGQSLVPAMNFRLAQPSVLVDLNRIGTLAGIEAIDGGLRIGGMTRHRALELSPLVARLAPLVAETMPFVAHPPIRTRGTLGGSLAHADPAAELPAVMLALDATIGVRSRDGARTIPASEFFVGLFTTSLAPGRARRRRDGAGDGAGQRLGRRRGVAPARRFRAGWRRGRRDARPARPCRHREHRTARPARSRRARDRGRAA